MRTFAQVVDLNSQNFFQHVEKVNLTVHVIKKLEGMYQPKAFNISISEKGKKRVSFPSIGITNPSATKSIKTVRH